MALVTERTPAEQIIRRFVENSVPLAVFCTASHWNTEAILLAAKRFGEKHGIKSIAVAVAMTFQYVEMPQAKRIVYCGDPAAGFISNMEHLRALCGAPDSPYASVTVLPHLDHAHPVRDRWALTEGIAYLASVMFDAQSYKLEENIRLTAEYVRDFGSEVLIEGILDILAVSGRREAQSGKSNEDYGERVASYLNETGVDFIVADLGTEQQSIATGTAQYLKKRAQAITRRLGSPKLVLHGTSCLTPTQITTLGSDGIIRFNMWTRIAREAGQAAAEKLVARMDKIQQGDFEATESRAYLHDSIERAAEIMEEVLGLLGYWKFAGKT